MTLVEQIQKRLLELSPEKQREVLDFVDFLQLRPDSKQKQNQKRPLNRHPAFGSWKNRSVDSLSYEQALRSEWDHYE